MSQSFAERLRSIQKRQDSLVCVGLDTNPKKIPDCVPGTTTTDRVWKFNRAVTLTSETSQVFSFFMALSLGNPGFLPASGGRCFPAAGRPGRRARA